MIPRDWNNYLVAGLVAASLGYLPRHVVAVGVEPGTQEIAVHFQLTEVGIRRVTEVRLRAPSDPRSPIRWTYRARVEDESEPEDT